ncbi:MAG: YDG domain-containing protein, partial [Gaiellaceae bacterium]
MSGNQYRAVFTNTCASVNSSAASLTVASKNLTVNGITASNKVYDGNTSATINSSSASLVGVVTGDSVTLNTGSASGAFLTKTVGNGKTVQISGLAISGADATNYSLTQPTTTADISAKSLSVSFQAQNKVYDGNASATIKSSPAPSLVGVVSGDTVTLDGSSASASFANKNVGSGKTVTASGFTKSGADAGNYVFASPQGTTTADISAKNLTISGALANDRVYNGSTTATVDFSAASLNGVVSGDTVSIDSSGYAASFATKNVGTGKAVTVTGVTLGGGDAGNYSLSQPSGLTANITAKGLTISGA